MSDILPKYAILVKNKWDDYWILEHCTDNYYIAKFWEYFYSFTYNYVTIREHNKRNL